MFMGKVSTLTHFLFEPWCEDYSFLDQAVSDFQHDPDSILPDSINILELAASFDDPDVTSAVSSGFLHSVGTISVHSKPQLGPSIKSHKLWCQARMLLCLYH